MNYLTGVEILELPMMYSRRDVIRLGAAGAALALPIIAGWRPAFAQDSSLAFDASAYTELTEVVETAARSKTVTYRFYKAIPYVANPVDVAYQSLNLSVPVSIDGVAVDASAAPILLANNVGGYMPSSAVEAEGIDASGMTGMPPGGMAGMPAGGPPAVAMEEVQSGGNAMLNRGAMVSNAKLALAAGYVVVEPGARGRTLTDSAGTYYGVAPSGHCRPQGGCAVPAF